MVWLVLGVLLVAALAVVVLKKQKLGDGGERYPYSKQPVLFSPAERSFLGVLDQAVGAEYRIFGKVRVADVVAPRNGLNASDRQKALNRVSAKHFDFVLCTTDDMAVVCAIELDDRSHRARRRKERDLFLDGLCEAVALPLLRIPAQRGYSVPELKAKLLAAVGAESSPARKSETQNVSALSGGNPVNEDQTHLVQPTQPTGDTQSPACPKCSASMVRRRTKSGTRAGQTFWGCSTFPKCRGIVLETDQTASATTE